MMLPNLLQNAFWKTKSNNSTVRVQQLGYGMIIVFITYGNRIDTVGVTVVNAPCCYKNIYIEYLMFIWHEIYDYQYIIYFYLTLLS